MLAAPVYEPSNKDKVYSPFEHERIRESCGLSPENDEASRPSIYAAMLTEGSRTAAKWRRSWPGEGLRVNRVDTRLEGPPVWIRERDHVWHVWSWHHAVSGAAGLYGAAAQTPQDSGMCWSSNAHFDRRRQRNGGGAGQLPNYLLYNCLMWRVLQVKLPFWAICIIASLSFMRIKGIVGWSCEDSCHCLVPRCVILKRSMQMWWGLAIEVEHAAMYLASWFDIASGVGMEELALMRIHLWKIMYLMIEWPVPGQYCQLASEDMVKLVCGMQCWWHTW